MCRQLRVMRIEKRTMNWLPKTSLYHEQAARRSKQRAQNQAFLANQSSLAGTVGSIMQNYTAETTNIVSKVALARMGYNKRA